jgi:hypothetical protein
MVSQRPKKTSKQLIQILPILLLSLAIIQTVQVTHAQTTSNPWAIKLQVLNGENATASVFNPFDQIQLCANVTYDNASQPDVLVSFNVVGPSVNSTNNTVNTIKITRIEMTQANGEAEFSLRLPIEAQNEGIIIGTWNVTATISGAPPQSTSFTTQWALTTTAINLLNSQGKNQTAFSPGSNIEVQLEISNNGPALPANVTINMQDPTGQIINQTEILNSQIASSNQTQVQQTIMQVPINAPAGQASINVAIYKGTSNGTDIPAAENQTVYFTVSSASTTPPTPTPTPTPQPTPTSPPTFLQNSVSLFSWLLVATGLFTFTMLYAFLRRKPTDFGTQTPDMPPTIPSPTASTLTPIEPTTPQQTAQQPPPSKAAPTAPAAKAAPENLTQAAMYEQRPTFYETWQSQTPTDSIAAHLIKISETGKKVQSLETALKVEREQLNKEITELNEILEKQERAIKSYFDSIRQAVAAAVNTQSTEVNGDYGTRTRQANDKQNPTRAELNFGQNSAPPQINEKPNPQSIEINNKPDSPPTEANAKPNPLSEVLNNKPNIASEQSNESKNVKEPRYRIRREKHTQEEEIRTAEHAREDQQS